ncbi:hypothetical protein [Dactylosporangium matsuzakiense]|uniref:hypothetical protein n=1 Tax=Dactylosporangium matsuzakiense TaxID=53360 RepID=UPI0021C36AA0|nr:hypothetical protein [Dactylosporangium matsuzakiense]UWZ45306.1 hypothetical protein Dmats_01765 [Dactylosporangium matsuzakiense]
MTERRQPELSPVAHSSMRARWRALILTDPVARLVRNAVHADIHEGYDLRQLALAAIDLAVASLGFARPLTLAELIESIAELAGHMRAAPTGEHEDAARWVVKGLLNDADNQRAFVYSFNNSEEYAFKLLQLQDGPDGAVVLASPQAVMLYLSGLDLDVDDAEAAFSVVLQRQLRDRRFEAAGRTAMQAERVSVAMSASLADILDATKRDVRSVDWEADVPQRLARAREHVEARIAADADVLNHVAAGIDTETDPAVRRASGELVDTLRRIRQVHLDLAERVGDARSVFLEAQLLQVFARRVHLRLLHVEQELLHPVLRLPQEPATEVVEAFGDRVVGMQIPRLLQLDNLVDVLLAPPRLSGAEDEEAEEPGETEGVELQAYPPAVVAEANRILRRVKDRPASLSELLVDAGDGPAAELVLLSALWAYAPDVAEPDEEHRITIQAERTGASIDHPLVWGDNLLVSYTEEA